MIKKKLNFNISAKYYDTIYQKKNYSKETNFVSQFFPKNKKKLRILDLGMGTGSHLINLIKKGHKVDGVELSREMIDLAKQKVKVSHLRDSYPSYTISKNKIQLNDSINTDDVLESFKNKYSNQPINDVDGVKIEFDDSWVHLRKSNTEPIIRIYAESSSKENADALGQRFVKEIQELFN